APRLARDERFRRRAAAQRRHCLIARRARRRAAACNRQPTTRDTTMNRSFAPTELKPAHRIAAGSGAHVVAAALRRHGVDVIFGQSIPSALFLVAPEHGIRQIGYRTENAGAAMADAYARISHKVGVVTAQNGPAATLLVPSLAEAFKASVPIVAIVQDVDRKQMDKNAFQDLDHL